MSTRYSGWGVAGEQPKPAVNNDGWAANNSGWGPPREQPAFKFESSVRGVNLAPNTNDTGKKEFACTRCKNSFPSNNKLHRHIREGNCKSVRPEGGSDAEDFKPQPNSTWIRNRWEKSETVKEKAANEGAAENTSKNAKEARWGDSNSEIDQYYPYCTVHALLIRWEDGDIDFDWAINGLREVFQDQFGFHSVSSFKIPSNRPYEALESKLQYFKEAHSSKSRLLIVYYVGHGYLDLLNRMHWSATSSRDSPTLDWYALQVGLERTESDVLILLHACCSAGASNLSHRPKLNRGGRTEIIAACGFKSTTSGASFTKTLIGELKRMARNDPNFDECISAVQLHQRMLSTMLHQTLPDGNDPGIMLISNDRFSTPVYISLSNDFRQPSIPIKRFNPLKPLRRIRSRDSFRTFSRGARAEEEHGEDVPES